MMRIPSALSSDSRPIELGAIVHRCRVKSCGAVLPGARYDKCLACRRAYSVDEKGRRTARESRKAGES